MKKATMILSVLLTTLMLLTGCGNKNKIIEGEWVNQDFDDTKLTFYKYNKVTLEDGENSYEGTYKLIEINKSTDNYLINMSFDEKEDDASINVYFGGDGKYFNFDSDEGDVVTYEKVE